MTESRYRKLCVASTLVYAICFAGPAIGQTADAALESDAEASSGETSSASVGEIVVTAQKREESVNRVGMSISAFTGDTLTSLGIADVADLVKIVPGFSFAKGNYGTPVYTLRGIGNNEPTLAGSPTVSVYVDEVPLPYSNMTEGASLDMERVEVLKGPQGTLFGQNSTGGAINYIAAKPTATREGGFELGYGRFNTVTAGGFVSGPLSDTLRIRLAGRKEYGDPWQRSATRPNDRLGKTDKAAGRLLLEWTPSDRATLLLNLNGWTNQSDALAGQFVGAINPRAPAALRAQLVPTGNARVADWDPRADFSVDDDFWQASLRGDFELNETLTLTSISAYSRYRRDAFVDADGTPIQTFAARNAGAIESISQELRLAGEFGATARWLLGANYQHDVVDDIFMPFTAVSSFPFRSANATGRNKADTYSGFASVDFEIAPTLTLTAAARYSWQDRSYAGCLYDSGAGELAAVIAGLSTRLSGTPTTIAPGGCVTLNSVTLKPQVVEDELNEGSLSWKTGLNWQIDPSKLLYATVSRGYKSGFFISTGATFDLSLSPAKQEAVTAYEAGFKLGLLDRTLQLNGAAFYYDYKDKQVRGRIVDAFLGPLNRILNVPESRVYGAELQMIWEPVEGLTLNGGATYINSKILGSFTNFTPLGNQKLLSGEPFPLMPKWQVTGDVQYEYPVSDDAVMFVGANGSHQGKTNAALGQEPLFDLKSYTLVDLRAGFRGADDNWRVTGFVRNLGDVYYWTNVPAPGPDAAFRAAGMPRTYGVTASIRFR